MSPDGSHPWFYAHRPNTNGSGGVQIAPILHTKDGDKVIFIETERPPVCAEGIAERCIEFPAGLVGDLDSSETVLKAAQKEICEETGYLADNVEIKIEDVPSTPGSTSEINSYAIADIYNDKPVQKPLDDDGVNKGVHIVPFDKIDEQLVKWQKEGKAISAMTYVGIYYLRQREQEIKKGEKLDANA